MPFSADQLDTLLTRLQSDARQVAACRAATSGAATTLSPSMAAILGRATRRDVPVLQVAVEAIAAKLFTKPLTGKATVVKQCTAWLDASDWPLLERRLFTAAVGDGTSYLLATWQDGQPTLYHKTAYDGVAGAATVRDPATGALRCTVNIWKTGDVRYLDAYYPDRIETYQQAGTSAWTARNDAPDEAWPIPWTAADGTPLGLALLPFGEGGSAIASALQLQDDLNHALIDLLAVSKAQGWPQRFITGDDDLSYITGPNGQPLRNIAGNPIRREITLEPGTVLPLRKSELKQLSAASVDTAPVRTILDLIALQTGVPTHYFTGSWPSGVALLTVETRLNTKVEHWQGVLTGNIQALLRLLLGMSTVFGGPVLDRDSALGVEWYPPQIETEDLQRAREAGLITLVDARLMSRATAIAALHPDWDAARVQEEIARIDAERAPVAAPAPVGSAGDMHVALTST